MDLFRPEQWPRFVRFPAFTRDWGRLGLDDTVLRALELEILNDPGKPPIIPGTGGLRKIRFCEPGSGRDKRGASRDCFAAFPEFGTVALVAIFGKAEKDNLTKADRNAIAQVIAEYREELVGESRRRRSTGDQGRRGDHGQDD